MYGWYGKMFIFVITLIYKYMYTTILGLHSYLAFAVLGLLLIASLNALVGLNAKRPFLNKDRQIALIALIFAHTQLLLGLILLFTSPYMEAAKQGGMGAVMRDDTLRLYLVEHPLINIVAIILITIGWSKHKKVDNPLAKFKRIGYMYAIAFLLLLTRIPWSAWLD